MPATTAQVARIANVSPQTVRNYTREYAELLSPAARGEGGTRLFDDQDIQVFCAIADLRKSGVPPAEVIERIRRNDVVIDVTPQQATSAPPNATEGHSDDLPHALVLSSMEARIAAVERHQQRLLDDAWDSGWERGVVVTLAVVGFLLGLAWLLTNGAPW